MALPKDALYTDNRVYLVRNGRLEPRKLVDFVDDGAQVLLKSGLAVGDVVLLTRFNEAAPGVAVKVVEQPDEPDHACCSAFCKAPERGKSSVFLHDHAGLFRAHQSEHSVFPTTEIKNVNIIVPWPGATAQDIDKNIVATVQPKCASLTG